MHLHGHLPQNLHNSLLRDNNILWNRSKPDRAGSIAPCLTQPTTPQRDFVPQKTRTSPESHDDFVILWSKMPLCSWIQREVPSIDAGDVSAVMAQSPEGNDLCGVDVHILFLSRALGRPGLTAGYSVKSRVSAREMYPYPAVMAQSPEGNDLCGVDVHILFLSRVHGPPWPHGTFTSCSCILTTVAKSARVTTGSKISRGHADVFTGFWQVAPTGRMAQRYQA